MTPAERCEARGVGARERERIGDARCLLPKYRVAEHWRERGFERAGSLHVHEAEWQAEFFGDGALAFRAGQALVGAIELEPAGVAQIALGTGVGHQGLMLRNRGRKQRPRLHGCDDMLGRRVAAEIQ
jgi:hypothetical protein